MAWSPERIAQRLITLAEASLSDVQQLDVDLSDLRALIKLEGRWLMYRIIVSEIHRPDNTVRYSYYVLSHNNQHVHRFDNAGDRVALKLRYGDAWAAHQHEEIPHQHDGAGSISLTEPISFAQFIEWLRQNLTRDHQQVG